MLDFFVLIVGVLILLSISALILPIINFIRISRLKDEFEEFKTKTILGQRGQKQETTTPEQTQILTKELKQETKSQEKGFETQEALFKHEVKQIKKESTTLNQYKRKKAFNVEALFLKVGALFVFLGLAWFVKYAVSIGLIGPYTLAVSVLSVALFVMFYAFYDSLKNPKRASVIFALSSSTALGTLFVSTEIYKLFPLWFSFTAMISVAAMSFIASYKFNNKYLATFSFVLSAVVPYLNSSSEPNSAVLLAYFLVLSLGTGALVSLKNWDFLQIPNIVALVIYTLTAVNIGINQSSVIIYILIFLFNFLFTQVRITKNYNSDSNVSNLILSIVLGLSTIIVLEDYFGADSQIFKLIMLAFAAIYSVSAVFLYQKTQKYQNFTFNFAFSLLYIFYVLASIVEKAEIYMAFAPVFIFVFATVSYLVSRDFVRSFRSSVWLIIPSLYSLFVLFTFSEHRYGFSNIFEADTIADKIFFNGSLSVYSLIVFSIVFILFFKEQIKENFKKVKDYLSFIALELSVVLMVLIWKLSIILSSTYDQGVFVALTIYTTLAVILYFIKWSYKEYTRKISFALFTFVIARVLLIDVWNLDILARIAVFVTIGILLIITTYKASYKLKENKKEEYEKNI